CQQGNSNPLSF
nr:immunoglobulin light chain junction region [Macaca mulatta]MOW12965.1 immunoglobulin light chain junction region [Macaca mulatta]